MSVTPPQQHQQIQESQSQERLLQEALDQEEYDEMVNEFGNVLRNELRWDDIEKEVMRDEEKQKIRRVKVDYGQIAANFMNEGNCPFHVVKNSQTFQKVKGMIGYGIGRLRGYTVSKR